MVTKQRYYNLIMDSDRWNGFEFRDDDIIICTPPKCGTTWTQRICSLLIFGSTELDRAMDRISPWLDQLTESRDAVVERLNEQTHRRFIKTHTPFDGLPDDDRVTYIFVGRDPRDVAMSWANHMENMNFEALLQQRDEAVGLDDLAEIMGNESMPVIHEDPTERFWEWVDNEDPLRGLRFTLHYADTFWQVRDRPNIVLMHYDELKDDLDGRMRQLAGELGIEIDESAWPSLVRAATFDEMKSKATQTAPNATKALWNDTSQFFNKGTSGQWREAVGEDAMERYAARVNEIVSPELSEWLHRGSITN